MEMIWHGTLAFELVRIPIRLYKATRERRLPFHLVHATDLAPIGNQRICTAEQRPVPTEEIVRALKVGDEWVVVSDEEIHHAAPRLTRTVEIRDFVDLHEIDPVLFRKPYYLAPDDGGEEMYVMLREAIRRSGKVGIAELVLLHREHVAAVMVRGEALVLETLYYPEEIIDAAELELPAETRLREGEIRMAVELIRNLSTVFEPARYRNEFRAELLDLVRRRAHGEIPEELEAPAPARPTPVIDLSERLRQSLERTRRRSA
ncbi:MAG TPA: Ku protein [Longimicrobiales bacterium]|nr:Ku protein [Longimicrobiales bacterium]